MQKKKTANFDLSALRIDRESEPARSDTSWRDRFIKAGAIIAIVGFFLIYIMSRSTSSPSEYKVTEVVKIYPSQALATLTATGYVVAQRQAAIASKATGRLEYLGVEEGDEVQHGQLIAQLEHDDVDAALARARANLSMAEATLEQRLAELAETRLNYDRQKDLLAKKLISQSDFDIAEARFKSSGAAVAAARAQIEVARAEVTAAEVDVENTRIRAPFAGTVLTKNADVGEMVAPFAASANSRGTVVTIADMRSLEVEADVSEANIQRVQQGQPCEIILDAFPDMRYPAYVHKIVPTADRAKATVLTKIRFKERDSKVLPEMSAKVHFLADAAGGNGSDKPFYAVPEQALTKRNGRPVVFVVRANTAAETPVEIGRTVGDKIEIVSGLNPDDKVVTNPSQSLKTGDKVNTD